jgi:uncharacterized protein
MIYNDKVYGNFNITEPVILELLKCSAFKRLKDIDQGGYGPLFAKPYKRVGQFGHNRFTHSIGVYLLLKKYGAPLEEQIAGLIHDVSHSAFSHCIDYIVDNGNGKEQNHQDNLHDSFVKKTDIPKILKKYGFNINYILDDKNFPLKENKSPDLCADRIDFSLRDAITFEEISQKEAQEILDSLIIKNNNWVFKNFRLADKYAKLYLKINKIYYAGIASATMFATVGNCIKYALQKRYIKQGDLYTTDKIVIAKIKKYLNKNKKINLFWRRMNDKNSVRENAANYDKQIFCKSRIVDPLFINKGKIKRLSQARPEWGKIVKQELKPKQYFLKYNY